jgi:hypothetical protein
VHQEISDGVIEDYSAARKAVLCIELNSSVQYAKPGPRSGANEERTEM